MVTAENGGSVVDALLNEIQRVATLRGRWIADQAMMRREGMALAASGMSPGIMLMEMDLHQARTALNSQNAIRCIEALKALQGYEQ